MLPRLALLAASPALRATLAAALADRPGFALVAAESVGAESVGEEAETAGEGVEAAFDRVAALDADVVVWAVESATEDTVEELLRRAGVAAAGASDGEGGEGPGASASEREGRSAPAVVLLLDRAGDPAPPRALVLAALRAGARAVLPIDADATALALAVESAAAGLVAVPAELAGVLLGGGERRARSAPTPMDGAPPHRPTLSAREREVLALLAEGLPNKVIAPRLGISEHTVKAHVAAIFEKLGTGTRAEAVVTAARQGLLLL
jgi:DNA-binding NarL/FixJ family response regulator